MHVVSGRRRAEAKEVKGVIVSPMPWRMRRIFVERDALSEGGMTERVREEGKSDFWGTGAIVRGVKLC